MIGIISSFEKRKSTKLYICIFEHDIEITNKLAIVTVLLNAVQNHLMVVDVEVIIVLDFKSVNNYVLDTKNKNKNLIRTSQIVQ